MTTSSPLSSSSTPLVWSEDYFGGAWLVRGFDDVEQGLRDTRLSARRTGGWLHKNQVEATEPDETTQATQATIRPFQGMLARALLFVDAPDHGRLRGVMMGAFQPHALQALGERLRAQVRRLLDDIDPTEPFDFIQRIAQPVPAQVVSQMLGLDYTQAEAALRSATDLAAFIEHPDPSPEMIQRAQRSALAMAGLWRRWLDGDGDGAPKVIDPNAPDALLSRLLAAHRAGRIESREELLAQCVTLLFAGHETTRHLLGLALDALLADPVLRAEAQRDSATMRRAVREVLRHSSPVKYTARRVGVPFTWHGHALRRGELVLLMVAQANRDATHFREPDQLDLRRDEGMHLAFGVGPHVCIGAALTQLEAEIVLTEVLTRWPNLHRVAGAVRIESGLYQGWRSLPVSAA
ncbi:MAG: cytochrome P450 [Leptothrix ochracea]|uniref:cytochrome P450 n=1 Tax=Leptothrix ochracea TaxID=735331 RepID=UPI0034E1C015